MSLGGWFFAAVYDRLTADVEAAGLSAHRHHLLASAAGHVLEIGAGTGANLPHYPSAVDTITLVEPERPMARRLSKRLHLESRIGRIVRAPAERLAFADGQFDVVVSTLVLCTVRDPHAALSEIRRTLKPHGRLLFIEHVRSGDPQLAKWQDRLNPLNRVVAHGCNCNRSTVETMRAAGFRIVSLAHDRLHRAPAWVRPLVVGTATPG
jgi:ubiquinone/menaquinone biosynthesis C-methylase UbiE